MGLMKSLRGRIAATLAIVLLVTSLSPAVTDASESGSASQSSTAVTEAVYGPDGKEIKAAAIKPALAGSPLSWDLLSRLNHGFLNMVYATYDTPITKLSEDERYLAFMSYSLDDETAMGRKAVLVQDRKTGQMQSIPTPDRIGTVVRFDMTPDARYIAYTYAEDSISAKTKVYLYDKSTDSLETVNGITAEAEFRMDDGEYVSLSADGRYVVFDTEANGIVPGDTNNQRDIYLYDRLATGSKLQRISKPIEESWNNDSLAPVISSDGNTIAFVSKAQLTSSTDFVGTESIYVYDRNADAGSALKRITQGKSPSISGDGRLVAFSTYRADLAAGDSNNKDDIYVYDHTEDNFERVSFKADGNEHTHHSSLPSISRNGAYVAYEVETVENRDETEIYVADSQGLVSTKVTVPNSPLLSPSKNPTVSDRGNTVTFYSSYMERIGSTSIEWFDYFIATNGTAPVWPAGSELRASNLGDNTITLSWPAASDPENVTGYALYKSGAPAAYIPATSATSYTITLNNQVREADTDYLFQVEAIDSRYHMSTTGPSYNWEGDGNGENPPPAELIFGWTGERSGNQGPLIQGSTITLYAQGTTGREATVELSFKVWNDASQVSKTSTIVLAESPGARGYYTGSFELPQDATELSSLKLTLSGGGEVEQEAADDLPVAVAGSLEIGFTGAAPAELKGAILNISNPESGGESITLDTGEAQTISGLWPGDEYEITLYTPDNLYRMGSLEGISIQPGKTNKVTVPVTLPAQVRVKVLDAQGKPVPYVPVSLWDGDHQLLETASTREDGMTNWRDGLLEGQTITAELDLGDFFYELAPGTNLSLKLEGGDNVLTVHLLSPERGNLEVTVKNPENKTVFNAYVTATQMYKGKPIVTQGRTSLDGKVRFELFAGDVVLEAGEYSYKYSSDQIKAKVIAEVTTPVVLPVKQPDKYIINLRVFKKALDTEWQGPLNMENENFYSIISSQYGWVKTYYSNAVSLGGSPGTPVEVCVSGVIYAYVNSCKNVIMDENSSATAEIRLEETGARVQGKVEIDRNIYYSGAVYQIKENGNKEWVASVWDNSFQTDPFNINVPRGGSFRMELTKTIRDQSYKYRYEYAVVDFTIGESQIKNLGAITFSSSGHFINRSGNYFTAQPARAIPGSNVTLKASYRNNNETTASNAILLLDIPEGMTLVSDSNGNKAVTGAKGPVTVDGQTLRVPLGDLAKDAGGTVSYKLLVSPSFNKNTVTAAARIQADLGAGNVQETIGTVHLDTPKVTLDSPGRIADTNLQTVLSGYAPAGSTVAIYDTNIRIGAAVANATGLWKTQVTLTDLGNPSVHALWAETSLNNVKLQSEKVYAEYDKSGPQLVRMAFAQAPAGRWVTVETGKDAPDFAYTVVPGNPFLFDFEFTNPDQVENVRVYMDGQEGDPIPAVREGTLFRATVPTTHDALGGIYVDYDVKNEPRTYDGTLPDLEAIRASMPPLMRDFELVSMTPFALSGGQYSGSAELRFPQLKNKKLSMKLTVNPDSGYKPTTEEIELTKLTGVPAVGKTYDFSETDTSMIVKISGYMPSNLLSQELQGLSGSRISALAKEGDWGHTAEYFMEIKADVDEVNDSISGIKDQYEGYMDYAGKINKIMYNVEASGLDCLDEMPNTAKQAGKALAAVVLGEVAKTAMGAGVGVMALSGPGGAVAGVVTGVIGDKIDNYVDEQIDSIGSGYNECNDPNKKKKRGRKVAGPKWIYDPSGFVYEAVKSNPLEGVTATVLYMDTESGTWKVWNAGEYDQVNPQLTDAAGKYGWDVPVGKWKVVWNKEGYEPESSSELDVPPPHTEVNAGLISRTPPQISSVTGVTYEGGSYVDITFTKYLKVTDLDEGTVTITDSSNAKLKGTAEFIKQEESANGTGHMLSRNVRFILKEDLTPNAAYNVKLNRNYFTSYANAVMQEKDAGPKPFTVKELDTTGPAVDSVKVESGGRIIRVVFNEPIQSLVDASKFQLNQTADTVNSAVAVNNQGALETRELLLTLSGSVTEQSTLTLLASAVKDIEGNVSAEASLSLTPDLNPNLSSLSVGSGTLTPAFNPAITAYNLELPAGTKELSVTAVAADAGASLRIGTETALNGLAKTVTIPDDGMIKVMVEVGGGVSVKTYSIKVSYKSSGGLETPPGSGTPPVPVGKDPLNLGGTAEIKKTPSTTGGNVWVVNIRKEAVVEALKNGVKGKELFVEIKDPADQIILQLPAEAWRQLENAQSVMLVKSDLMNIRINAAALQTKDIADGATIRWVLSKTERQVADAARAAARKQSSALEILEGPVAVQVEAVDGSRVTAITWNEKELLQGEFAGLNGDSLEVYRYNPASATWAYIQTQKDADSRNLLFNIDTPGHYAIMRFNNRFEDTEGHWAEMDIDWMARRLLVNGVSPTEFKPQALVTRAEFAAMLVRALGIQPSGTPAASSFTDVSNDSWYFEAVLAAASSGLVTGLEQGRFAPDQTITREQMAVMISRAYKSLGLTGTANGNAADLGEFSDSSQIGGWAKEDVSLVLAEGFMKGVNSSSFKPEGISTRSQAVVVLARLLKTIQK
jgi:large repetitive protein